MRIKRGFIKRRNRKKVLAQTKGYRLSYSTLLRRAKEASLHAGQYSYAHRKKRKSQFRTLWIQRINSELSKYGVKYSEFIKKLTDAKINLDRKSLSEIALLRPEIFEAIVAKVK